MQRKGAINLSINMIIVLIIAIVILGFALSFVTDMFTETEEKFEGLFPTVEVPVDADNPIGIGENFKIRPGKERRVTMNIYNTRASDVSIDGSSTDFITCSGTPPVVESIQAITVPPGETKPVKAVIKGAIGMDNNDICTISLPTTGSETLDQSFFLVIE